MNCPKCGSDKMLHLKVNLKSPYHVCQKCDCVWTDWQLEQIAALTQELSDKAAEIAGLKYSVGRKEELYKSSCKVGEDRRKEIVDLKQLIHLLSEPLEYAVDLAHTEAEGNRTPGVPVEDQPADYLDSAERAVRFENVKKTLEAHQ